MLLKTFSYMKKSHQNRFSDYALHDIHKLYTNLDKIGHDYDKIRLLDSKRFGEHKTYFNNAACKIRVPKIGPQSIYLHPSNDILCIKGSIVGQVIAKMFLFLFFNNRFWTVCHIETI